MKKQPFNYIIAPSMKYISGDNPARDSFLLIMIAVLHYLESETNFAHHIKQEGYNKLDFWTGESLTRVNQRNALLAGALETCAKKRINVRALTGNRYK